jgi:hypothetical protein
MWRHQADKFKGRDAFGRSPMLLHTDYSAKPEKFQINMQGKEMAGLYGHFGLPVVESLIALSTSRCNRLSIILSSLVPRRADNVAGTGFLRCRKHIDAALPGFQ